MTRAYSRFAWGVLGYSLGVIAWGAYVRATGSGAGCGQHWPTCQGAIVPRSPALETLIEYSHRVSSGLALLLISALVVMAFRLFPKGHAVRRGAVLSGLLIVVEALLGAALVLFGLVARDASLARGIVMPIHLVNTLALLASLSLTAWWASGGGAFRLRGQGGLGAILGIGAVALALVSVTGALAALGDTLFPARSLAHGLHQDASAGSSLLVRLRLLHPVLAVAAAAYLLPAARFAASSRPDAHVRRAAWALIALAGVQLLVGLLNLALLAPVPMQLLHLLVADLSWIALVLLAAAAFSSQAHERRGIASALSCASGS